MTSKLMLHTMLQGMLPSFDQRIRHLALCTKYRKIPIKKMFPVISRTVRRCSVHFESSFFLRGNKYEKLAKKHQTFPCIDRLSN